MNFLEKDYDLFETPPQIIEDSESNYQTGWVKLFRSVMDKAWYQDSEYVHLWIHLLMKANHSGKEFLMNNKVIKLKAGQFVTGRKKLSLETGIKEWKIEKVLKCFENDGQIQQQSNSQNRLLSIVSWDCYQNNQQQSNSKATTKQQQSNTNNNEKNDNNEDNDKKETFMSQKEEQFEKFWDYYGKKEDRAKCYDKFLKLTDAELEKIKDSLPLYIKKTPDKKYRKNPFTYLNGKCWNDEEYQPKQKPLFYNPENPE
jgi:hypothetical protein